MVLHCNYEANRKEKKEELVKQIKLLKAHCQLMERIFDALSSNIQVSEILQRLKNGDTSFCIVDWLGSAAVSKASTSGVNQIFEKSMDFEVKKGAHNVMRICSLLN